jgi:murein hydrolase activator
MLPAGASFRRLGASLPCIALCAHLLVPAFAQDTSGAARKQLEASRHQLEEAQRRAKELQTEVGQIKDERERLSAQLVDAAKSIQAGEGQMTRIEARIGELQAQEDILRGSLEKSHGSISTLLATMQRMGRNPPPVMVTKREDALKMVRSAMLLATAFPELRGQAQLLSEKLGELVRVIDDSRKEGEQLRSETARLEDNRLKLANLLETRKRAQAERQDELTVVRKAAADIARNVSDFNELATRLERIERSVADKTQLGNYERQLAADAAKSQVDPQATAGGPTSPVTSPPVAPLAEPPKKVAALGKPAEELRPSITLQPGERMAMSAPGRIQPSIPFEQAKGRLLLPAAGRQIQSFGDRAQSGRSDGIVIETRPGAQVVAPNDGWIMYAGEFRSFGQILIINGGGGYHVLLAGLSQIDVAVGQFVLAGEPVGVMVAAPKTASTKTQETAPVLYVEFRKNQRPIDPGPWWAEATRKVAG